MHLLPPLKLMLMEIRRWQPLAAAVARSPLTRNVPASCPAAVEAALAAVPGVQTAAVSLTTHQAEVRYAAAAGGKVLERALIDAVEACGFDAVGKWRERSWRE